MRKDLISLQPIYSSFLADDKDVQEILKILFVTTKPYSDRLKKLLVINSKDCLEQNEEYQKVIDSMTLGDLIDKGYIRLNPKITRGTHEEMKAYMIVTLDNFRPNIKNPEYRDYNINFDIVCYNDAWVLNDYKIRPLLICGYIDGILNSVSRKNQLNRKTFQPLIKLSGIGNYQFLGCNETLLNEDLSMYSLTYHGSHFSEDIQEIGKVKNG